VTARAPHVPEERLLDCYLAERAEERIDPPTAEHLADCDPCAVRYAELTQFLDDLRTAAAVDTDALFTPDRLRAQQHEIARRLEPIGRAARVISFPGRFVSRHIDASLGTLRGSARVAPRMVAAAAATGLFLGVGIGASVEWSRHLWPAHAVASVTRPAAAYPSRLAPVPARGRTPAALADDDAFLSELEIALERPRTRELQPFDAFTPHVRAVKNDVKNDIR
jgi:hypothetical protein